MAEVELECAVYGEATVFPVKIARDAKGIALQKAIFDMDRYKERFPFDASELTLYLAKKDGAWLKHDYSVEDLLQGMINTGYKKILSSWKLNKTEYFGDFQLASCCSERRETPFATNYTTPSRLRRWAAINAMIRQKNQDANQKTTTEDAKNTNKKRKKHDIDKSVGYSTLCWEDIKPIYNFDDSYELQPSDIPDADIELLLARIRDLRELYGKISNGKEAKRLIFIAPILETVSRLLGDFRILVEEDVVERYVLLKGRFEFVLKRGTKRISIVEAKREDMLQGVVQNVTGLEALADVEDLTVTYGIVTNFLEWKS
ncbi:hypothetical protein Plhal304r1_c064g0151901 [Plasmopara halstedii]